MIERTAKFSKDRRYRYYLKIVWGDGKNLCQFVGLNPSIADEYKDDPTLRRVKEFARAWGYSGVVMTNLFAWRDTDPAKMKQAKYPIGELGVSIEDNSPFEVNDYWLATFRHSDFVDLIVAAWGRHGRYLARAEAVMSLLPGMKCLGRNSDGTPKHPLYLRAEKSLEPFN